MARNLWDRRDFIKAASSGLAGGYVTLKTAPALAARHRRRRATATIIDPPAGDLLKDPVEITNISNTPGLVEVDLEALIAPVNINGTTATLKTYNGLFPAPTIRVTKGDILKVNLKNLLPPTTSTNLLGVQNNLQNLHTHGWHVSPKEPADYILYSLPPGETYVHEYDTSLQDPGTLSFYHPHVGGLVAEQVWAGLSGGALVVEDETPLLAGYETHILLLKDITLDGSEPQAYTLSDFTQGKEGNIVMVNGQVNPRLYIKAGQVQRWRIVNSGPARFYKLSVENHTMQLIGTDGGLLDKPYPQSEILISPGERVDVLVQGTQGSGSYRLQALPYSRGGMMGSSASQTITLMTLTYEGADPQEIPASINPNAQRLAIDTTSLPKRSLALSMRRGRGYINGQDFDVNPYTITSDVGTYEVWSVINQSGYDHPFHQHVNAAQVLSISGGDAGYASLYTGIPGWKDTIIVPRMGRITMLVPIKDFDGITVFHCHILEHEDIGMMGIWDIR